MLSGTGRCPVSPARQDSNLATHAYNNAGHISCDINLPYFIPGKSKLIVQKTETTSTIDYGQPGVSHHQPGEETITQEELAQMAIGHWPLSLPDRTGRTSKQRQ